MKDVKLYDLYMLHWNTTSHYCKSCNKYLGTENKTTFHDHLLEKNKHPEYKYELWNLFLVCEECHDKKTRGFPTEKHEERIKQARDYADQLSKEKE